MFTLIFHKPGSEPRPCFKHDIVPNALVDYHLVAMFSTFEKAEAARIVASKIFCEYGMGDIGISIQRLVPDCLD
jgi:hypothetical protein